MWPVFAGVAKLLSRLTAARAAKLDNLDTAVTSRAAASDYTAGRAAKLDYLDAAISGRAAAADYTAGRAAKLDNLDAAISTRAPSATALSTATWTAARAGYLNLLNSYLNATISSRAATPSVQRGQTGLTGTSTSVTISSVTLSKSFVSYLGWKCSSSNAVIGKDNPLVYLYDSTTLKMEVGASNNQTLSWEVVSFG
jgi:hypothetical protein